MIGAPAPPDAGGAHRGRPSLATDAGLAPAGRNLSAFMRLEAASARGLAVRFLPGRTPFSAAAVAEEDSMLEEFKKFALRGNVVDLAIGVIIGSAFGKIVESLVGDVFMPIIGAITGGLDFSNYFIPLSSVTANTLAEARKQGAVLAWGSFVTVAINFLIVAWVLFLAVKVINRLKHQEAQKPSTPPLSRQEVLLEEIRDILAKKLIGT